MLSMMMHTIHAYDDAHYAIDLWWSILHMLSIYDTYAVDLWWCITWIYGACYTCYWSIMYILVLRSMMHLYVCYRSMMHIRVYAQKSFCAFNLRFQIYCFRKWKRVCANFMRFHLCCFVVIWGDINEGSPVKSYQSLSSQD